jgi:Ni,Fe-hydrogenase III large subunit/Ni,Fe-hydrogenase III component G
MMTELNSPNWMTLFVDSLRAQYLSGLIFDENHEAGVSVLKLPAEHWSIAIGLLKKEEARLCSYFADELPEYLRVNALFENKNRYLLIRTPVFKEGASITSITEHYPAADRLERYTRDMYGIALADRPSHRRWIRHKAWKKKTHPLRSDFHPRPFSDSTPADKDYFFESIPGAGVFEIPVGPIHAGIIEPGHFRFTAVGETVLKLEERLGYTHKGIEKLAVGRTPEALMKLAARISGDTTVGHSWAAAMALETACHIEISPRAEWIRGILSERERIANHLGDIGGICNDVGFSFALMQCARLKEQWIRRNDEIFEHRYLMDMIVPGGVRLDISPEQIQLMRQDIPQLIQELNGLFDILLDHPPLQDRLLTTGLLSYQSAKELGTLGYVGRASGFNVDVRRQRPYGPYVHTQPIPVTLHEGDVQARMRIRMKEIYDSLELLEKWLSALSEHQDSILRIPIQAALDAHPNAEALGCVEGWRGEIITYIRLDETGHIARFFPRDPSWFNWPALERIQINNIVPDFPVCNKSVNASYSGHDL